jgi:hypothetical protein
VNGISAAAGYAGLKSAVMEIPLALHGLTPEALAEFTETHVTTARRWLKRRSAPRAILLALALLRLGDLGAVSPEWAGWTLRDGILWSPEGTGFDPGQVRSGPLFEQAASGLRAQLLAITVTSESGSARRARIEALAALENAQAAAVRALTALTEDLPAPDRARLFELLDSTRRLRERSGFTEENAA